MLPKTPHLHCGVFSYAGPQREKWAGNAGEANSSLAVAFYVAIFLCAFAEGVFCIQLQGATNLHGGDIVAACLMCMALFYLVGEFSDSLLTKSKLVHRFSRAPVPCANSIRHCVFGPAGVPCICPCVYLAMRVFLGAVCLQIARQSKASS